MQTMENPPYKGGCPKIGLDRREGINQNTPNPGLALRWPHPCSLLIELGSRGCPSNVNLRPRVVLDTQVWLPARDGDEKGCHPSSGIMINSRGESRTKALERTEASQQTHSTNQDGETRGNRHSLHQILHAFSGIFACSSGGSPGYGGWPLIKINSFHNNIWFDLDVVLKLCNTYVIVY